MRRLFKRSYIIQFILLICLFAPSLSSFASPIFPSPTSYKYVNDYVGLLNKEETQKIVSIGKELEDKTGAQAVIVIIDSTNNAPIEDYANKLFRTWGIGQKNKNNGLLILIALNDRSFRVEVGKGLEGAIPDALSNRVMESLLKPHFSEGNYGLGLVESYSSFADLIGKEYGVTLDKSLNIPLPNENQAKNNSRNGAFIGGSVFFLFVLDFILNRGRVSSFLLNMLFISSFNRRGPRGGSGGGGFGGFGGGSSNGGGSSGNW